MSLGRRWRRSVDLSRDTVVLEPDEDELEEEPEDEDDELLELGLGLLTQAVQTITEIV